MSVNVILVLSDDDVNAFAIDYSFVTAKTSVNFILFLSDDEVNASAIDYFVATAKTSDNIKVSVAC